ncbi:MAG TPA: enoyl-CoA hydratase-related protein [Candidatus Acidoferrales bacterium]|nr:enoyl-CoA hydratase-related protein [Candidatus Acidoferrales bacterium]
MPFTTLQLDPGPPIATITLARPEKRNAINPQMIDDLLAALDSIGAGSARLAILTGAGKAFCAGMDLEALRAVSTQTPEQNLAESRRVAQLFRRLWEFPKVLIAAVNGAAIAGGCGLATMADFTLAVPEATFGYTEVRIGFLPAIVSVFLRRQVGDKIARDLLLTGRLFSAQEAHRLGLVSQIVPADSLLARAHELATTLLANSPSSLLATKKLLRDSQEPGIDREISQAIEVHSAVRATGEFREGIAAFLEKRAPRWGA